MKLNLNKDKAWILSVTVVCVALLIGFAMWLNKPEVKSSLNKDNPAPEEETKEEEITELFEEEDFGETSYSFESVEIRNFDIEVDYATVNIKIDENASYVSVFTHIATKDDEITVNNVGSLIVIRQISPSDATSSSGSYVEIVMPPGILVNELTIKAIGGVVSIAVDETHFEYVALTMGSGTMYVDILNADEAHLNCKEGLISIKDFRVKDFRLKTSEGGTIEISTDEEDGIEDNAEDTGKDED